MTKLMVAFRDFEKASKKSLTFKKQYQNLQQFEEKTTNSELRNDLPVMGGACGKCGEEEIMVHFLV